MVFRIPPAGIIGLGLSVSTILLEIVLGDVVWLVVLGLTALQSISGRLPERGRKERKDR